MSSEKTNQKPRSLGATLFRVFAGYEVAIVCLFLLFVATFFGTLEQKEMGLYRALRKYFDMHVAFVVPTVNGKVVPLPLPGVFWVSALLFVNLTLGGLVRARKGWKTAGVLISHFGMLFLLVAGAVSHLSKREGVMHVYQGDRSDYARSYTEPSIEIYPYDENGERAEPYVVPAKSFRGLGSDDTLTVRLPDLPFDLEVTGFLRSSELLEYSRNKDFHQSEPVVDGFFLKERKRAKSEERNMSGCYVTVQDKSGKELRKLVLHYAGLEMPMPVTATVDGKRYGFSMVREMWPMPFEVELRKTMGEYYPGTQSPSWFQSDITKVDGESRTNYSIVMNKPMRHGGITLYQASWAPPMQGGRPSSGFAIVENPSDQWPKYALYVATLGLVLHFGLKLGRFLNASRPNKSKSDVQAAS